MLYLVKFIVQRYYSFPIIDDVHFECLTLFKGCPSPHDVSASRPQPNSKNPV